MRRVGRGRGVAARRAAATSASTTRRAMSSCSRNRSPSDDWTVCDVSSVPPGASTSCAAARSWSPARSSVPITTRSTSASAASALRSGASPAKRAAVALERTTSEPMPDSDVAMASGRLKARKSVSGSGRRTRNGSTTRRVSARARAGVSSPSTPRTRAQLLGHRVGRGRPLRGPLGQRAADHAVDRGHGRRAGERRRLLVERGVQDLDDVAAAERRAAREHLEQDGARREQIAARVDGLARHLLGRHVARRAHHHPGARQLAWPSRASAPAPGRSGAPGRSRAASRRAA